MKHIRHLLILPLLALPHGAFANSRAQIDSVRVDTLKEVEVRTDSNLRVNEAIRQSIEKMAGNRIGTEGADGGLSRTRAGHQQQLHDL